MVKHWWARIVDGKTYGSWLPTGCVDKQDAVDYMKIYRGNPQIKEWLQL